MKLTLTVMATTFRQAISSAFDPESPLFFVIWSFAIGLFLALILGYLTKRINGYLVRALLKAEAFTPESSQNLADLGCNNFYFRWLLREAGTLRRLIFSVQEEKDAQGGESAVNQADVQEDAQGAAQPAGADAVDAVDAVDPTGEALPRYYIPEQNRYRAERIFSLERGMELMIPLFAAALFGLALFCFYIIPKFL